MPDRLEVRRGSYHDSIKLMLASRRAGETPGVTLASVVMGTPLNLDVLSSQRFGPAPGEVGPNDLLIAIRADSAQGVEAALASVDAALSGPAHAGATAERAPARSIRAARRQDAGLNMAFVSVPGPFAAYEVASALELGLDVMCFSDGVEIDDEAALKTQAAAAGRLLMGPDCGTAIIGGVGFGFANAVERGPVGIVGASGTGIQQLCCLLDAAGIGISHAIGVGGRDLSEKVGGRMTRQALSLLADDPATETVVIASKPPHPRVAAEISQAAAELGKPAVLVFMGLENAPSPGARVSFASTLEAGAARVAASMGGDLPDFHHDGARGAGRGYIRGLFCGGTLCDEAMIIISGAVGEVESNIPLRPEWRLEEIRAASRHACIDFGDDRLTQGRAHPMIDPTLRTEQFEAATCDGEVAVVLLDVILGYGAHPDPAGELAPAIAEALRRRDDLRVVVSLCGVENDPQGLSRQRAQLEAAGAEVTRSNAEAARISLAAAGIGAVGGRQEFAGER
jgi:FdrA protein